MKVAGKEIGEYFDNSCSKEKPLIWVATLSDGTPHLVPVCFVKPIEDSKLLIANNFITKTVRNIAKGSKVAVGVATRTDDGYDGYMIKGSAKIVKKGPLYEDIRRTVEERTKGKRRPRSAILVSIDEVYSLKPSPDRKRIL